RILENDGYLKTSNNNRTVEVVTFTAAEMRDMYEIREAIDGLAARLAAARGLSPEAEAEAKRLLAEMASTSKPHDPLRRVEAATHEHDDGPAAAAPAAKPRSQSPARRRKGAAT